MFKSIQKYAKTIADNIEAVNNKNIEAQYPKMIKANIRQLDYGELNTGALITPEYSESYAKYKGFRTPDLLLHGDFRRGFDIVRDGMSLIFGSNDEKTGKLTTKYSYDIFGLNKENADESFEVIGKKTNTYIDKQAAKYL